MRGGSETNGTASAGPALRVPRPFQDSYAVSLAVAVIALVPFIILSTASLLYEDQVVQAVHTSRTGIAVITGLGEAGYAFGALLGGDLAQRFPQRPMFLLSEILFVIGAVLAAVAGGVAAYGSGFVLMGLSTGLLLVLALPPVIQRFPPERMPTTAAWVNIGFFGAVTAGPLIGGAVAAFQAWRWFHGGLACVGAAVLLGALFTFPDREPPNRDLPFDRAGIALGLAATVLLFVASGELSGHGFGSAAFLLPAALGLPCFIALLLVEYHKQEPLAPVRLASTTYPVIGILVASIGGGAFVTFLELAIEMLRQVGHKAPLEIGLAFWPQIVGVLIAALLLGVLLRSRHLPLLILGGMLALVIGGAMLLGVDPAHPGALMLAAVGLLGIGAGATVSPGLYLAGFSLPAPMIGRIFALVELVRSVADYILAPVMRQVARVGARGEASALGGLHDAVWVTLFVTIEAILLGLALYVASGGLPRPDLERWLKEGGTAIDSPPLGLRLRSAPRRS